MHTFRRPRRCQSPRAGAQPGTQHPQPVERAHLRDLPGAEPGADDQRLGGPDRLRAVGDDQRRARRRRRQPVTLLARTGAPARLRAGRQVTTDSERQLHVPAAVAGQQHLLRGRGQWQPHVPTGRGVPRALRCNLSGRPCCTRESGTCSPPRSPPPRSWRADAHVLGHGGPEPTGPRDLPGAPERLGPGLPRRAGERRVSPDSTYSIPYQVYNTGTKVFRVYIPGGPENEGAASQPFTIQVHPAPARR